MIEHGTLMKDHYPKIHELLFHPATLFDWASDPNLVLPGKVKRALVKFNVNKDSLVYALTPGQGPEIGIVQLAITGAAESWDTPWFWKPKDVISDFKNAAETAFYYRIAMSFEKRFLTLEEFRDYAVIPLIVGWFAGDPNTDDFDNLHPFSVALDYLEAAYGNRFPIPANHLLGWKWNTVTPPGIKVSPSSSPPQPKPTGPIRAAIRKFVHNRRAARAARRA
jgi:hypothetical protein